MTQERITMVVADDDKASAELLCNILDDEGYHVICCFSGREALQAIQQHKPDLAILDMQMEKRFSGLEIVQMVRANPELHAIPVIIYSADNRFLHEMKEQLFEQDCTTLAKPFSLNTLLDMIKRTIVLHEREV
jgi:CheY-like chemotaxis protein